jgi:PAS domain S-box-containing protein
MARKIALALSPAALAQIDELRARLRDAEETLSAIRSGAVDAVVVAGPSGTRRVYTLKGADLPYRVLVESMNEGALTLSDRGVILYCNARMAELAGRPLERMMGSRFSELLAGGDRAVFARLMSDPGGPRKATLNLRQAAGSTPAQLSLTPLDLDGARAFSVIVTDLAEAFAVRQALLQKDAGLRLVAESAPAVLFTADSRGRVLSAAGAALKTIRGRVKALLAAPVVAAAAASRERASALTMRLRAVRVGSASYDASYAGRLWSVSLERLGIGGVIGIAVDVTDERRGRASEQTARRERLQREYVANVSHEFLTPLTAIKGYAESLLSGGLDDRRHSRVFVRTIERHTVRLTELVENLLYLSAMEAGGLKTNPSAIDAGELVRGVLKDLLPLSARRRLVVRIGVPKGTVVRADPTQLRRVFMNVALNGIKYNRPGGRLTIEARRRGGLVGFVVADTGIGISSAELPLVFERFHRTQDARRLAIKGAGMGLSIAKMLVELNKGRIWVESAPGKGTRLQIQLPSEGSNAS